MSDLVTGAQMILLARTLHVPVERLAHLERLGAEQLHELQRRMAGIIFDRHAETFRRISKLVPFVPLTISMPLVQRIVPPMMTGRAAGAIGADHPEKAAETISLLGVSYAADCTPYVDPRTFDRIADAAPAEAIVDIVNEILRRRDFITVGPFLEHATPTVVDAIEQGAYDDEGLIFSFACAYNAAGTSTVLRRLLAGRRQRIPQILHTVLHGSPTLQLAALSVFARCDEDVVQGIGNQLIAIGSTESVSNFVTTAVQAGASSELLTFVARMHPRTLDNLAAIIGNEAILATIIASIDDRTQAGLWRGFFALAERVDTGTQRRIVRRLAGLPDSVVAALPSMATEADMWHALLRTVAAGNVDVQAHIGAVWATLPPERRAGLEWRIREVGLDSQLVAVTRQIPAVSVEEVFFRRRRMRRRGPAHGEI